MPAILFPADLTALLNYTGINTGDRAFSGTSNGYYHYWDAASTATHDGTNVIKPTAVSGAGRWLRGASPIDTNVPVGTIIAYPMETPPTGFVICEGAALSRTTYSALFAVISTRYGAGDGSTTFNVPDYRGEFLRGRANGSANDPDRATRTISATGGVSGDNVGSKQDSAYAAHTHNSQMESGGAYSNRQVLAQGSNTITSNRPTSSSGSSTETRPRNVYVQYCIRY